jgi:dihydroorotase
MHGLNDEVTPTASDFFSLYAGRSPAHYGGAFRNPFARRNLGASGIPDGDAATPSQIEDLAAQLAGELDEGWIGVDFEPEYTPGIDAAEIDALTRVAWERGFPAFFHGRFSDPDPPGTNMETIDEILQVARDTGAAVHVDHITSTGGTFEMAAVVERLEAARAEGIDVTADFYPYTSWATNIDSARWNPDTDGTTWQERFRIDYDDLQVAGTDERLDEVTFKQLQLNDDNPIITAVGAIPEEDIEVAMTTPWIMVASDGILSQGDNNHPRASGCFAHTLGEYVRERETLSLMDALAKMTILPVQRLETAVPALRTKGRLARGGDADITVFDPETIDGKGTIEEPSAMSAGIEWVLVDGIVVKTPDMRTYEEYNRTILPGRPITA